MNKGFAIVFPGQGSQSVGMLSDLIAARPVARETFEAASTVLGYDLLELVLRGPEDALGRTDRTQPAMLAADVAVWRAWKEQGGAQPLAMAGHSLGEYAALVCAEALAFEDAVRLVAERGRFMQEAVPEGAGAMAALLGLEDARVQSICAQAAEGEVVAAVNFNSPGQVVIAGATAAVERAIGLAREAGAKRALMLPVSVPSHCALMAPAADRMRELLDRCPVATPRVPVVQNADVAAFDQPASIRDALVRQLCSPVRWVETVLALKGRGASTVLEFGPGKVLTGLNKRIDRELAVACIHDPASLDDALAASADGS